MTEPPADLPPGLLALAETQAEALLSAEVAAAVAASSVLRDALAELIRAAVGAWHSLGPAASISGLLMRIRTKLIGLPIEARSDLLERFEAAYALGIEQGWRQLGMDPSPVMWAGLPDDVREVAETAEDRTRALLHDAAAWLDEDTQTEEALIAGLAQARKAVTSIERSARWGVNRSAAEGITAVQTATESKRVWLPERDACVHCLAYAGEVTAHLFPAGLTFGEKPLNLWPVQNPPLHPNCRCQVMLWRDEWNDPATSVPDALKREARRSIARGWSVPSESERVRLNAAARLLARGADLPKSVEDAARRAVKRGSFPRGRTPPG